MAIMQSHKIHKLYHLHTSCAASMYCLRRRLCVRLSAQNLEHNWSEIDATWQEYVPRWTLWEWLKVGDIWPRPLTLRAIFVFFLISFPVTLHDHSWNVRIPHVKFRRDPLKNRIWSPIRAVARGGRGIHRYMSPRRCPKIFCWSIDWQ